MTCGIIWCVCCLSAGDFDPATLPHFDPTPGDVARLVAAMGRPMLPAPDADRVADLFSADSQRDFRDAAANVLDPGWNEDADWVAGQLYQRHATAAEALEWRDRYLFRCQDRAALLHHVRTRFTSLPTKTLHGVVLSSEDRSPIATAPVRSRHSTTTTDEQGRFELAASAVEGWIGVHTRGFARIDRWLGAKEANGEEDIQVLLPRAGSFKVRVLWADGKPVADAVADILYWRGDGVCCVRRSLTDEAGWAEVSLLPADAAVYRIVAKRHRVGAVQKVLADSERTIEALRKNPPAIQLDLATRIAGIVVDRQGRPAPLAVVQLRGSSVDGDNDELKSLTDREGRFSLLGAAKDMVVVAERKGFAAGHVALDGKGLNWNAARIELCQGEMLRGRILGSDGKARPQCLVTLPFRCTQRQGLQGGRDDPLRSNHSTVTDADGKFAIGPLDPSEKWAFFVQGNSSAYTEAEGVPGGAEIEVRLAPGR